MAVSSINKRASSISTSEGSPLVSINSISFIALLVTQVVAGMMHGGAHTCVELIETGYEVFAFDNIGNSNAESLLGVERITGMRVSS